MLFFACTPEEDDIFGDSSANRMEAELKAVDKILNEAEKGWIMEYYPSATQQYGGYTMIISFNSGSASISSEVADVDAVSTSFYALKQSAGAVLTFDDYNPIMHYFSNPKNPGFIGVNGRGMEGDYEFLILDATNEKISLKGKKTGSYINMIPFTGNSREEYLSKIQDAGSKMVYPRYIYEVNNLKIPVSIPSRNSRSLVFSYEKDGQEVIITAPFLQTTTGFKFYTPLEIEGIAVEELTFNAEGESGYFTSADNKAKMTIVLPVPHFIDRFINGANFFAASKMGSVATPYWQYAYNNGLSAMGEIMDYAYLGAKAGNFGFHFLSGRSYAGSLFFDCEKVGDNKIILEFNGTADDNGVWYYQNAYFNYLIEPLGGSGPKTFTLSTDNMNYPRWIKLTEDANPDNEITLYGAEISNPFDN